METGCSPVTSMQAEPLRITYELSVGAGGSPGPMLAKEVVLSRHSSQGHHQGADKASAHSASRPKQAAAARQALRCRRLHEGSIRLHHQGCNL